jgi:hypothetical protein
MIDIAFRQIPDAPRAAGREMVPVEPSHIHIPRPSRVGRASVTHRGDPVPAPVQLEPALDETA